MSDLEKDALKRDHGFLVRLVIALVIGVVASLFLFGQLTSDRTTGCATDAFQDVTQGAPSE